MGDCRFVESFLILVDEPYVRAYVINGKLAYQLNQIIYFVKHDKLHVFYGETYFTAIIIDSWAGFWAVGTVVGLPCARPGSQVHISRLRSSKLCLITKSSSLR